MADKPKKKVVRAEPAASSKSTKSSKSSGATKAEWKPTAEAKGKATQLRIFAWILWILAIAGEAYAIFFILKKNEPNMTMLYIAIGVIAVLAFVGNILWKNANKLDPAHRSEPFKFWVQNQLGAIITLIAFLPLIIFILMNKDISQKDKTIATIVAAVVGAIVLFGSGITYNSPSVEKQTALIEDLTGGDYVYWTKSGEVYHLCDSVSAVNLDSADGQIYEGSVGKAFDEGKSRLTLQVESELNQCGYPVPENIDAIVEEVRHQADAEDAEMAPAE